MMCWWVPRMPAIVYDAVLHTYPDLEFVELPELAPTARKISVGVIQVDQQPQAALHFARYISARDRGLKHYREHGFRVRGWRLVERCAGVEIVCRFDASPGDRKDDQGV